MGTWHPKGMGRQGTKGKKGLREHAAQEKGQPKEPIIGSKDGFWDGVPDHFE